MPRLHELASLERRDIGRAEFELFAVLSSRLEPLVPVGFDAARIVRPDDMGRRGLFGKLYGKLVLSTPCGVGFANFVETSRLDEIDETNIFRLRPGLVAYAPIPSDALFA